MPTARCPRGSPGCATACPHNPTGWAAAATTRPRRGPAGVSVMGVNDEVAALLREYADLLAITGGNAYK